MEVNRAAGAESVKVPTKHERNTKKKERNDAID